MRQDEEVEFREGVVIKKIIKENKGSFVNVGLKQDVQIDVVLGPDTRVTVQLEPETKRKVAFTSLILLYNILCQFV